MSILGTLFANMVRTSQDTMKMLQDSKSGHVTPPLLMQATSAYHRGFHLNPGTIHLEGDIIQMRLGLAAYVHRLPNTVHVGRAP